MTEILCYEDSYLRECKATVTEIVGSGVVLDQTVFYPGGGGQPCDTGTLEWDGEISEVSEVSRINSKLVHQVTGEIPYIGQIVVAKISWEKRYQLMRTHTALHILCGVVWRDYSAQVTGGNMTPLRARMDFELAEMSSGFASEMETLVNKEVKSELENLYEVLSSIVPKYLNKKMKNFQDMSENNITLELIKEFR